MKLSVSQPSTQNEECLNSTTYGKYSKISQIELQAMSLWLNSRIDKNFDYVIRHICI